MKKVLKIAFIILFIAFIVIQFVSPVNGFKIVTQFSHPDKFSTSEITNDDVTKKLNVPDNIQTIVKRSCYDCHSNQSVWPWYSNVAPVSWLVLDDVVKGRKKLNFSEWGKLSAPKQEKKLSDIVDMVSDSSMPLPKYLLIHKDAVLSPSNKDALIKWANEQKDKFSN
jgi:hypothetical protein